MDLPLQLIERLLRQRAAVQGIECVTPDAVMAMAGALASVGVRTTMYAASRAQVQSAGKRRRIEMGSDAGVGAEAEAEIEAEAGGEGAVIRADDAYQAIAAYAPLPLPEEPSEWYVIPVKPDGACLFTSLGLVWELYTSLRAILAHARGGGELPPPPLLKGRAPAVLRGGEVVRQTIIKWFKKGLDTPLPGGEMMCCGDEGARVERRVTRGDLIAADAEPPLPDVLSGQLAALIAQRDTVAAGAEREALEKAILTAEVGMHERTARLHQYLHKLSEPDAWGSLPELRAWAYLTQLAYAIYSPNMYPCTGATGVVDRVRIVPPTTERVPKLKAPVPHDVLLLSSEARESAGEEALAGATAAVPTPMASEDGEDEDRESEDGESGGSEGSDDETLFTCDEEEREEVDASLPPSAPFVHMHEDEYPFAGRLLHDRQKNHYSVLVPFEQYLLLTHAYPSLAASLIPLRRYFAEGMF